MKRLSATIGLTIAVLLGSAGTSWGVDYSSEVQLKINRVYAKSVRYLTTGRPTIILSLTNRSAYTLRLIGVDCAFFKDGNPVATAVGAATNLRSGGVAIETIFTMEGVAFDSASCRISDAIR